MDCQEELKLARTALEGAVQALSAIQRMMVAQQKVINERLAIVGPAFLDELMVELNAAQKEMDAASLKTQPYFDQVGLGRLANFIPGSQTKQ